MNLLNNKEILSLRKLSMSKKLMNLGQLFENRNNALNMKPILENKPVLMQLYNAEIINNENLTACKYELKWNSEIKGYINDSDDLLSFKEDERLVRKELDLYSKLNDIVCFIDFKNSEHSIEEVIELLSIFEDYSDLYLVEYGIDKNESSMNYSEYPSVKEMSDKLLNLKKTKNSLSKITIHKIFLNLA